MNYENDIRIDESSLDLEWLDQPLLMMRYTRNAAVARKKLEDAKERLEFTKAKLDKDIRTNPDDYDLAKVTDAAVSSSLLVQEEYTEAYQTYITAKFEADVAQGAVNAIEQRKSALENLVRLYGLQYFAGPKEPVNITREWKDKKVQERADSGIAAKLNQKPIRRSHG